MKLYNFHFGGLAGLENKNCYKYNEYLCLIKKKQQKNQQQQRHLDIKFSMCNTFLE